MNFFARTYGLARKHASMNLIDVRGAAINHVVQCGHSLIACVRQRAG
jgi:hypothetical protein